MLKDCLPALLLLLARCEAACCAVPRAEAGPSDDLRAAAASSRAVRWKRCEHLYDHNFKVQLLNKFAIFCYYIILFILFYLFIFGVQQIEDDDFQVQKYKSINLDY